MQLRFRSASLAAILTLAGCTGGTDLSTGQGVALATVDVVVTPADLVVASGAPATFAASVTGTADTSVTWSVQEGAAGGSITASGWYTAPEAAGTYHVVATSRADPSRVAIATVTVSPVAAAPVGITIAPTAIVIAAGNAQTFTCYVVAATSTGCTFSVEEGAAGGVVTSAGAYTAPTQPGTFHVVATSRADPSKTAAATVIVTSPPATPTGVVAVTASPVSASVSACQAVALSATVTGTSNQSVTWSLQEGTAAGTITAEGLYSAPAAGGTFHAVATSVADPTKSATATIVVADKVVSVSVSPASVTIQAGQTVQFTASVTTTCGTFQSSTTVGP